MKTEYMTITPAWAQAKLDKLTTDMESGAFRQRPPRHRAIQRYAADMKAGKWLLTHQGIAFDKDDHLLDGQNRLWAVVAAGIPVKMAVTTDMTSNGTLSAMDVIDGGMVRSLANHLQISHGWTANAAEASTLVRTLVSVLKATSKVPPTWQRRDSSFQISVQQAVYILDDLGFRAHLEECVLRMPRKKLRHRAIVLAWCLYRAAHPNEADVFATDYATLENLPAKSPALLVNRFLTDLPKRGRKQEVKLVAAMANGIYAHYKGLKLGQLNPSKEALEWLVNENDKLVAKIVSRITP